MAKITNIDDAHNEINDYRFHIYTTDKRITTLKKNMTKSDADEQAWKWLNTGISEVIVDRIVCCDSINVNLVEIKKVRRK